MSASNSVLTYELNLETGDLTWGDALYTVYGYGRDEDTHRVEWWANHILPDDAMRLNEALDKLFMPNISDWTIQYHFHLADNRYVLVQDHAVIERDAQGKAQRLRGDIHVVSAAAESPAS